MKGVIKGLLYSGIRGTTMVEVELEGNQAERVEKHKGRHVDVSLKTYRRNRSLDANAYFWVLLDKLCGELGLSKTETYRRYVKEIGGNNSVVTIAEAAVEKLCRDWELHGLGWVSDAMPSDDPGYSTVILYAGSSTYNTKQMSNLINLVVQDCESVGIQTKTPAEIENMLSLWGTEPAGGRANG